MLSRLLVVGSLLLVLTVFATGVQASPPFDLTGDTANQGGQQARTVPGGSGAAYFNPALLTDGKAEATAGFMLISQHYAVTLDGRPGTQFAIEEGLENAAHAGGMRFDNYPIATNTLQFGRTATARRPAFVARPRQGAGSGEGVQTYEVVGLTDGVGRPMWRQTLQKTDVYSLRHLVFPRRPNPSLCTVVTRTRCVRAGSRSHG